MDGFWKPSRFQYVYDVISQRTSRILWATYMRAGHNRCRFSQRQGAHSDVPLIGCESICHVCEDVSWEAIRAVRIEQRERYGVCRVLFPFVSLPSRASLSEHTATTVQLRQSLSPISPVLSAWVPVLTIRQVHHAEYRCKAYQRVR